MPLKNNFVNLEYRLLDHPLPIEPEKYNMALMKI
jgi:hypothetical protein